MEKETLSLVAGSSFSSMPDKIGNVTDNTMVVYFR